VAGEEGGGEAEAAARGHSLFLFFLKKIFFVVRNSGYATYSCAISLLNYRFDKKNGTCGSGYVCTWTLAHLSFPANLFLQEKSEHVLLALHVSDLETESATIFFLYIVVDAKMPSPGFGLNSV
jgi:hypothetical protein